MCAHYSDIRHAVCHALPLVVLDALLDQLKGLSENDQLLPTSLLSDDEMSQAAMNDILSHISHNLESELARQGTSVTDVMAALRSHLQQQYSKQQQQPSSVQAGDGGAQGSSSDDGHGDRDVGEVEDDNEEEGEEKEEEEADEQDDLAQRPAFDVLSSLLLDILSASQNISSSQQSSDGADSSQTGSQTSDCAAHGDHDNQTASGGLGMECGPGTAAETSNATSSSHDASDDGVLGRLWYTALIGDTEVMETQSNSTASDMSTPSEDSHESEDASDDEAEGLDGEVQQQHRRGRALHQVLGLSSTAGAAQSRLAQAFRLVFGNFLDLLGGGVCACRWTARARARGRVRTCAECMPGPLSSTPTCLFLLCGPAGGHSLQPVLTVHHVHPALPWSARWPLVRHHPHECGRVHPEQQCHP